MRRFRFSTALLFVSLLHPLQVFSKGDSDALSAQVVKKKPTSDEPVASAKKQTDNSESKSDRSAPAIHAASAVVVDAQSGKLLYALNPDEQRAVASTQKLMTALLVTESGSLDKIIKIEASDTWAEPSKLDIAAGETYRKGDLLRILMVKSMNDVARALARDTGGSIEGFAKKMNAKAEELGMTNSHFVNPNGLPAKDQYSTARDMSKVAIAAYRNKAIREAVRLKELSWQDPDGDVTVFHNTNRVLSSLECCNGMKTGYTVAAGFCLVSSASLNGRDVIAVVLGDKKEFIWKDSQNLLSWALGLPVSGVPVASSKR
ncbi:MAG: D-alanyl-D-alanine carboxypeptidase family protein [Verrucomicrobiota bacterium]